MTNEEQAREIIGCQGMNCLDCGGKLSAEKGCSYFQRMMEMAQWKDKQFSTEKQELVNNAKDFLAEYFWEHPHYKNVIQSDEFMSIDDMLEKFENKMKVGNNE